MSHYDGISVGETVVSHLYFEGTEGLQNQAISVDDCILLLFILDGLFKKNCGLADRQQIKSYIFR